jgi:ATP-dependent Clp protease ATP-binding subunit ClpC
MIEVFKRMTDRSRLVLQLAEDEARDFGYASVRNEHLLLGLAKDGSGVAAGVLKHLGADYTVIRATVEQMLAAESPCETECCPFTLELQRVLHNALTEAYRLNHHYIGTEHLLLALLDLEDVTVMLLFTRLGLKPKAVREETLNLLGHEA